MPDASARQAVVPYGWYQAEAGTLLLVPESRFLDLDVRVVLE